MTDSGSPAVLLRGVTKRFGSFRAVDGVDLVVPRGAVCGFLGQNGAGKTTTIRMILSIFEPSEGSIEVLGARSALEVRNRIGYLPEEKGLYRKMKARDLVAYFGTLKGMAGSVAKARARELLERFGLGEFVDRKCDALSKGMQQKVQLLASIVHDPELVILDEPFSGLDPVNQEVMEGAIADLRKSGHTVIFSTHVMEHAERLCDRLFLIAGGRKVFDGTLAEAKRSVPRRVRIETVGEPTALRALPGVRTMEARQTSSDATLWELSLDDQANPHEILETCFRSGIPLRSFDRSEVSLREVFMTLVKSQGRETLTQ